jgi:NAD(P)H-quinone oxidoreductase subunit K
MPKLKYVIAMGACTITRGLFNTNSNSIICGVDKTFWANIFSEHYPQPKRPSKAENEEKIVISVDKLSKICWENNLKKSFEVPFLSLSIWKIDIFWLIGVINKINKY